MMKHAFFGAAWALSAMVAFAGATQARPLEPAEKRMIPWSATLPGCSDPDVLDKIISRFSDRESSYWKSGLEITAYDDIRQIGFRTIGLDYIPRRYCMARALLNDGRPREVSYAIGEDLNFAGGDQLRGVLLPLTLPLGIDSPDISVGHEYGVDFCVAGLDRNYAYAPNCKAARP